jgi:hypothetical protein
MPPRRAPFVGAPVTVLFLGRRVSGTVEEVGDHSRRLVVLTADDELIVFTLRAGTGYFVEEGGDSTGARLVFDEP